MVPPQTRIMDVGNTAPVSNSTSTELKPTAGERVLMTHDCAPLGLVAAGLRARVSAAAIHFAVSLLVVGVCALLLVMRWYPDNWIHAAGGVKLLLMLAAIDLILGPLLTGVVFDRRKKSLPFDLAFIVVLQLGALGYGLYAAYQGRPVFNVFVVDRFEMLSAADVDAAEQRLARPEFAALADHGPVMTAFVAPADNREKLELTLAAASGVDARYFLRYFVPIDEQWPAVLAAARPLAELGKYNDTRTIEHRLRALDGAATDRKNWRYLPVQGRNEDLSLVIDGINARPLGLVRLTPWSTR